MQSSFLRLTSFRNLLLHSLNLRIRSVSSFPQLTYSDNSDSSSDENTVSHLPEKLNKFTVTETLHKLSREPRAALSFISQLNQSAFKHDVVTYIAIIRLLCDYGLDIKLHYMLMDVIHNTNKEFISFGISDLFEALIDEITVPVPGSGPGPSNLIKALDVLVKVYAGIGKFDEAIDVLYKIKRGGLVLSARACNYLLNQLISWGKLDMFESVYKQLTRKGLVPDAYTYGILIKGLCRKGCLEEAFDVFREMREAGVESNSFTFGTYIDGLCSNGKADDAFQIVKSLPESNVQGIVIKETSERR